jgi:hypothetical protein
MDLVLEYCMMDAKLIHALCMRPCIRVNDFSVIRFSCTDNHKQEGGVQWTAETSRKHLPDLLKVLCSGGAAMMVHADSLLASKRAELSMMISMEQVLCKDGSLFMFHADCMPAVLHGEDNNEDKQPSIAQALLLKPMMCWPHEDSVHFFPCSLAQALLPSSRLVQPDNVLFFPSSLAQALLPSSSLVQPNTVLFFPSSLAQALLQGGPMVQPDNVHFFPSCLAEALLQGAHMMMLLHPSEESVQFCP